MDYDIKTNWRFETKYYTKERAERFCSALCFLPDAETFAVGCDNRMSSPSLKEMTINCLLSFGKRVIDVGVLTTPALSFCTCALGADYGIMITGGSSLGNKNGYKVFDGSGCFLDKNSIFIPHEKCVNSYKSSNFYGAFFRENGVEIYCKHIEEKFSVSLCGKEVYMDVANGCALPIAERLFTSFGADIRFFCCGYGENINKRCGAAHPHFLRRQKCTLAFSVDGDGDRGCAACENRLFSEEEMLSYLYEGYRFSSAVCDFLPTRGEKVQVVKTGETEREAFIKNSPFGVERGGKYLFSSFGHTFDGVLFALLVSALNQRIPLCEYFSQS